MLKKTLLLASIACLGFADIAYSQNNPPSQHKTDAYIAKKHPILFNANLLVGQIDGTSANYGIFLDKTIGAQTLNTTVDVYDFPNKVYAGFRFGLGVGLSNIINLSVQWTYFSPKDTETKELPKTDDSTKVNLQMPTDPSGGVEDNGATLFAYQKMTYHTLDLLVQTAAWMLTSNIRFQPFGGVRYLQFKRQLCSKIVDRLTGAFGKCSSHYKTHATGVLIGTDIKYIFARHFYFFSNAMLAILSGFQKRTYTSESTLAIETRQYNEHYALSFSPMTQIQLGLGFENVFNQQWLLSLFVAYELSSWTQTSNPAIEPGPQIVVHPLRSNQYLQTQFVVFGAMFGF